MDLWGKGWANKLAQEPKDDKWSLGIGKIFVIVLTVGILMYLIQLGYDDNLSSLSLIMLSTSLVMLIGMYIVADYEEKHQGKVGFAFFGNQYKFGISIILGVLCTSLLTLFLGHSYCSTERYIDEGYCVKNGDLQQFILPIQAGFIQEQLVEPFYSTVLAPSTEELFFRVFLFYSLLAITTRYFTTFKKMQREKPILLFLLLNIVVSTGFGVLHFFKAQAMCPAGETICLFDRIWVSNIYGLFWTTGNQLTGGIGFSIAGHIINNLLGVLASPEGVDIPTFFIYVLLPVIVFTYFGNIIYGKLRGR